MRYYILSPIEMNSQLYMTKEYFQIPIDCMISAVAGYLSATGTKLNDRQLQRLERYITSYMYSSPDTRRRVGSIVEKSIIGEMTIYK